MLARRGAAKAEQSGAIARATEAAIKNNDEPVKNEAIRPIADASRNEPLVHQEPTTHQKSSNRQKVLPTMQPSQSLKHVVDGGLMEPSLRCRGFILLPCGQHLAEESVVLVHQVWIEAGLHLDQALKQGNKGSCEDVVSAASATASRSAAHSARYCCTSPFDSALSLYTSSC